MLVDRVGGRFPDFWGFGALRVNHVKTILGWQAAVFLMIANIEMTLESNLRNKTPKGGLYSFGGRCKNG